MLIDCNTCAARGRACGDCVITVLLQQPVRVEFDDAEQAAIDRLATAGLVPPLRLAPESGVTKRHIA